MSMLVLDCLHDMNQETLEKTKLELKLLIHLPHARRRRH